MSTILQLHKCLGVSAHYIVAFHSRPMRSISRSNLTLLILSFSPGTKKGLNTTLTYSSCTLLMTYHQPNPDPPTSHKPHTKAINITRNQRTREFLVFRKGTNLTSLSLNPPDPSPPSIITTILTNVFVKKPYTLTSSTTCNRPKYVSIVLWPESILSSMISRALCARKWYFSEGDGA